MMARRTTWRSPDSAGPPDGTTVDLNQLVPPGAGQGGPAT